ncbi:MAG: CocE/NonD family hydrolase [Chlorobi bacterium]|nr:CocE/NonD family hydrolase [Chlorobiota bacterium]
MPKFEVKHFHPNKYLPMTKTYHFIIGLFLILPFITNAQNNNGIIDDYNELTTKMEVPFTMPDGTHLMTDIYLPVTRDSMVVKFLFPGFDSVTLQVIPKGIQYIIYDSINGEINENPYQLPFIFTRTPYDKSVDEQVETLFAILGYGYALQDMRGRYASEGVYLPMYSDAWNKNPYHPDIKNLLDITELANPMNGNKQEDGYNSIKFLTDSLFRIYDTNTFLITNGSIGMIGASALANSQYQAASAHKINPSQPGLKCLFPIVGTNENYHSTGFHNGVFRQSLVKGWLAGQMASLNEDSIGTDTSISNSIHTPADYAKSSIQEVIDIAVRQFTDYSYNGLPPSSYPNSIIRKDLDASMAPVNEFGEGDSLGSYSRYTNMEVPIYHLTGWWDIFINGQIDTYNFLMKNLSENYQNKQLQKLVIGPWAHQTVGTKTTGDVTYKDNINSFIIDFESIIESDGSINFNKILNSDILQWFRYNLNFNNYAKIGNPKVKLPESNNWQALNDQVEIRFPSTDYIIPYTDFLNYLAGRASLPEMDMEYRVNGEVSPDHLNLPPVEEPVIPIAEEVNLDKITDFKNIPNVRLYVPGPINDGVPENDFTGNYWIMRDSFPFYKDINETNFYLHTDGSVNDIAPVINKSPVNYLTDPDDPVITVGGANMDIDNPDGNGRSQGQKNLADPKYATFTMDREGVITFETNEFSDSLSIVGIPVATLYASVEPLDSTIKFTDTDFFIRILDVYPNGKELFVVGGAVNARARDYAKSLANGIDDINIPFENIRINKTYEFKFKLLPIAYTFGKKHKLKVLISSSNYPRFQVNANVPVNDNEFFRREPGDGQTYIFNGVEMLPRKVIHNIYASAEYPTHIQLPVYGNFHITSSPEKKLIVSNNQYKVFPNPATDYFICTSKSNKLFSYELYDITGKLIHKSSFKRKHLSNINLQKGIYIIRFISKNDLLVETKKLIIH